MFLNTIEYKAKYEWEEYNVYDTFDERLWNVPSTLHPRRMISFVGENKVT